MAAYCHKPGLAPQVDSNQYIIRNIFLNLAILLMYWVKT